jgi:hypothetical protein
MRIPCRLNVIGGLTPGAAKEEEEEVKKSLNGRMSCLG